MFLSECGVAIKWCREMLLMSWKSLWKMEAKVKLRSKVWGKLGGRVILV